MITPNLNKFYKPELISSIVYNQYEELEQQADHYSKEASKLSEKVVDDTVELIILKSNVRSIDTNLLAAEERLTAVKEAIEKNDLNMI